MDIARTGRGACCFFRRPWIWYAVLLVVVPPATPALARHVCVRATAGTEITRQLDYIRSLMAAGDAGRAERHLVQLEAMLACTEVPVLGRWLARLYFFEAVVAWQGGDKARAQALLADALGAFRMFEWDVDLLPPREHLELYAAFRRAKAVVLAQACPARFVVIRGDRYRLVYVDGQSYPVSETTEHAIRPGRHIVQYQVDDNLFVGEVRRFVPEDSPTLLVAPSSVLPWEKRAEVAGTLLLFPFAAVVLAQPAAGVDLSVAWSKEHWQLKGLAAVYGEVLVGEGAWAGERSGALVTRVGAAAMRRLGSRPDDARVVPAAGVAVGAVVGPSAQVDCCADEAGTFRVLASSLAGGFFSSRFEIGLGGRPFSARVVAEFGYALMVPVGTALPAGKVLEPARVATPLAVVAVVGSRTF